MTWPLRQDAEHSYHHVMSRGTNQWNIFLDDRDRLSFLRYLARVNQRHGVEVLAYCLMGNHFHLVVYCPNGQISQALRDLKSFYARSFNQRHGRSGPLYRERFRSKTIVDDDYLLTAIRYVHRNPLDLDKGTDLASYEWSSHGHYLGLRPRPPWLTTRLAHDLLGSQYRSFIETSVNSDKVQNAPTPHSRIVPVPGTGTIRAGDDRLSLASILRMVARTARCDVGDVRPRTHNGLIGLAIVIALDDEGYRPEEVAEPFGFSSVAAVRKQAQRARRLIATQNNAMVLMARARTSAVRAADQLSPSQGRGQLG